MISNTLSNLPDILASLEDINSQRCNKEQLMCNAKQINATLAALGGFEETIKPGCDVNVSLFSIINQQICCHLRLQVYWFCEIDDFKLVFLFLTFYLICQLTHLSVLISKVYFIFEGYRHW